MTRLRGIDHKILIFENDTTSKRLGGGRMVGPLCLAVSVHLLVEGRGLYHPMMRLDVGAVDHRIWLSLRGIPPCPHPMKGVG